MHGHNNIDGAVIFPHDIGMGATHDPKLAAQAAASVPTISSPATQEMIWLKGFLEELGLKQENCVLFSDSQSAIHLAKNPVFHARTKHIDLRYHFIRSLLEDGDLLLEKILGDRNPADMLTKSVTVQKLKLCSTSVGLRA